jgi:hypothetical protein
LIAIVLILSSRMILSNEQMDIIFITLIRPSARTNEILRDLLYSSLSFAKNIVTTKYGKLETKSRNSEVWA